MAMPRELKCLRGVGASTLRTTTTKAWVLHYGQVLMYGTWLLSQCQPRSKEIAAHRCDKDGARHRKGVSRRFSALQIVFGGHQCAHSMSALMEHYDVSQLSNPRFR